MATTTDDESRRPDEEEDTEAYSDREKAIVRNLKKHIFVFPAPQGGYAFVHHGRTLWKNVINFWYKHFAFTEGMDRVYFPNYNGTRPIHPEAAEPLFTDLEVITKLPRAAAQVTPLALSCKISPQDCLVNVDDSTLGEIEHFMDSEDSSHPRYSEVSGLGVPICSRDGQTALSQGFTNNQTLAYFIVRVHLFLKHLGIDENQLRFRQLLPKERAPDVADCWVVEISCSSGWLTCACITHRSAVKEAVITPNMEELIPAFKDDHDTASRAPKALDSEKALEMKSTSEQKGHTNFEVEILRKSVPLTKNMVSVSTEVSLIKLSFYMGRIISCIYEHSCYLEGDKENQQFVFRFTPLVAPIKCAISVTDPNAKQLAKSISVKLKAAGVVHELNMSGESMGHTRTDELGVPFTVVVDSTTSVTIRERDRNEKIKFPFGMEANVVDAVKNLTMGRCTWKKFVETLASSEAESGGDSL